MQKLTERQAYMAMFYFLEAMYERVPSDILGGILGDMRILADGNSADLAFMNDWEVAIKKSLYAPQK